MRRKPQACILCSCSQKGVTAFLQEANTRTHVTWLCWKAPIAETINVDAQLKAAQKELHFLLDQWSQKTYGKPLSASEQFVMNNPHAAFWEFHAYYLANRKEARHAM